MTLDGLPLVLANGIGVVGVVVIVGWLVWTGRLIPRATHNDQVTTLKERISDEQHEKGEWRAESRIKDQQLAEKDTQLSEKDVQLRHLGEVGATMKAVLTAFQQLRGSGDGL